MNRCHRTVLDRAWPLAVAVTVLGCDRFAAAGGPSPDQLTPRGLVRTRNAPKVLPPTEVATFAAGCFWGVEAEFRKTPGVVATAVGFSGGHTRDPSYSDVCDGDTGHAESVEVEFDPKVISYQKLLDVFWDLHDPTTVNRQGPDLGAQYRSVIFYHSAEQKAAATASRDRLQRSGELRGAKIVTEIVPAAPFYKAEDYHQQYVEKGGRASCHRRKAHDNSL
jgi:peptide-methionine (S)-S-oxide reductase